MNQILFLKDSFERLHNSITEYLKKYLGGLLNPVLKMKNTETEGWFSEIALKTGRRL